MLDDGSTVTLLDDKIARDVGLRGQKLRLSIEGIDGKISIKTGCESVKFSIVGDFNKYQMNAITISTLKLQTQSISPELVRAIAKIASVFIQPYTNAQPKLLIGQDNWRLLATSETREILDASAAVSRSPLGWAVHGCNNLCKSNRVYTITKNCSSKQLYSKTRINDEMLYDLVKKYFELDDFGVNNQVKPAAKSKNALLILKTTTVRNETGWETGLIWKNSKVPEVDSRSTALKRLHTIEKRLDRDPSYATLYYREMDRFIKNGYAVKTDENISKPRIWYLPHFGVTNPNKPGKLRLVFDAAAKTSGISLNDQLDSGPDFLQSLPGVLLRFRQHFVAFKADIRDMYLRVGMNANDRGAQRFLWRGADRNRYPDTYEMTCLVFGANSSPASALFVKDQNAKSFAFTKPIASQSITRNFYMDDYLASCSTVGEASEIIRDVIDINRKANFEMHAWASNDNRVLKFLKNTSDSTDQAMPCDRGGERILGLYWDIKRDTLSFNVGLDRVPVEILTGARKPTKREFLRIIMSVYDPLGLIGPFTLQSRILMQEIWRSGIGWDDAIRDEEQVGWVKWTENLKNMKNCSIPRCITPKNQKYEHAQLHMFCDASLKAYTAVVYVRFAVPNERAHVSLVMAKTRVAPLKPMNVPRLELQAALLGSRLVKTVQNEIEIKIKNIFLWSDSLTVIRWIKGEPRTRNVFVGHRLGEINELTSSSDWKWVPTKLNPADYSTRWIKAPIDENNAWFVGPDFLRLPESDWPKQKPLSQSEKDNVDAMELRKVHVYTLNFENKDFVQSIGIIRLLGWNGLLVLARRVRKAADRWLRISDRDYEESTFAEEICFRFIQSDSFSEELKLLRQGQDLNKNSKILKLHPFLDSKGVLRVEGRVTKMDNLLFNNNPIILDAKHSAVKMLLINYHRRFYHSSRETIVNEIRQKYYIFGLRSALRSITYNCLKCKLERGKPRNPIMASLPEGRVAYRQRPFTHCGIDYFGPMFVKIGRRREKRWGVLFTCLTTRAVHVELAHSLTTSSAIMALQRLSSRRGSPMVMYSDNGTNFRGACTELKEQVRKIDAEKQREYALKNGLKWIFNPPDAPHMGGAWERLIKSIKTALSTVLKHHAPTEEVLYTLLCEIEHSVNSRPLTHVSVDPSDSESITPNHFLIGTSSGEIKLGTYENKDLCSTKQWKIAQAFADAFWRRWLREYVPTLLARNKWNCDKCIFNEGDIVLIADSQAPRNTWKTGKVISLFTGAEGVVRVAKIETRTGEYVRPVHKLILLYSEKVQN